MTNEDYMKKIDEILKKYGTPPVYGELYETALPKLLKCLENMDNEIMYKDKIITSMGKPVEDVDYYSDT